MRLAVPFADSLEGGLGNWVVSGYDWAVTATTSRSPTHSLTDSPGGDYLPYQTVSAILAHPLDLGGVVAPVLRFWHKGRITSYDYGRVEVSQDGGTTWSTKRSFGSSWYRDGWMLEQIDLPTSSNSNVVIRFTLDSDENGVVADGWYIDDVWVGPKDPVRLAVRLFDGFDDLSNWIVSGYDWNVTRATYHALPPCLTDSPLGNYAPDHTVSATLAHPLDLRGAGNPWLWFWHKGRITSYDYGRVEVSQDGGTTWDPKRSFGSSWDVDAWQPDSEDLPTVDNVLIRFTLDSDDNGVVADGWYIDDILIVASSPAAVGGDAQAERRLRLYANQPNPFRHITTIRYHLPQASGVSLRVFDLAGRMVRSLEDGHQDAGNHIVQWDARDSAGHEAAPGLYMCQLEVGSQRETQRLLLLR